MSNKRKTLNEMAAECAHQLSPGNWWYSPDIKEAFKRGWRARAKVQRQKHKSR